MNSIREGYKKYGVEKYYELHKEDYENPHEYTIKKLLLTAKKEWKIKGKILDLCCGSGEVSNCFKEFEVEGIDPYTKNLYEAKTNNKCKSMTFKDIVKKGINEKYDYVISSFGMHLCEESMLPMLLYRLSQISENLIIITPHKRPNCNGNYFKEIKRMKLDKVSIIHYKKIKYS